MSKKMLINAIHPEEARVAIVEDGQLVELDIEIAGSEQTRGNIYKGTVVRVEPGLQAAFVDIGLKKLGFLQMGELHPDNWLWRDDILPEQRKSHPRIQEILRRGQELIVQVEKGERDNKGAALTTYISLPGRYMVLMPGSDSAGISRKVEKDSERKKLKELIAEIEIPEGMGYIIRTEAVGRTNEELVKDFQSLLRLYENIVGKGREVKGGTLIYQESDLVARTIRDYFSADIDEVLVDSKEVFQQARAVLKEIKPKYEELVKMHQEKRPIFSRYQLEEQIDLIYEKKVPLKSGGSIFIEPTEALVSIDVNSGKSTGERGVEDTAFKTNMEAAEEAARQLRLRDLGGLIVIDFIDMRERKHNAEVEKTLKSALKKDKARVNVSRISQFGLLEMSRQRIRQTLNQASSLECPHCEGRGKVKSVEAMALSFLRKVHAAAAKGNVAEVRGGLPLEVAYYLLNRKKRELAQIENDYDIEVTVKGKPSFLLNQLEVELIKREKPAVEEQPEKAAPPAVKADKKVVTKDVPVADEEEKPKKKRRRGKKKPAADGELLVAEDGVSSEEGELIDAPASEPVAADEPLIAGDENSAGEERPEEQKKKRRRKRKRGGKGAVAEASADTAPGETVPEVVTAPGQMEPDHEAFSEGTPAVEEVKKKRRRKRRRGPKTQVGEVIADVAVLPSEPPAAAPLVAETAEAQDKPKKARAPRPKKVKDSPLSSEKPVEAPVVAPVPVIIPETAPEALATVPKKRAPRKKPATPAVEVAAPEIVVAPVEKPVRKRAPRKKKETPAAE